MVEPTPPHLSPEQRERLDQLVDASQLRAALFQFPKPPSDRRRSRRYPGGQPNPWWSARPRRRQR
ncbi:hypothetical protein [Streptomyces sp. NBC_00046]|uniref:hypothetical protein n=1 Tax=unclassified Streptomyces TaxID=2593676 RepID=UPI00324328E0